MLISRDLGFNLLYIDVYLVIWIPEVLAAAIWTAERLEDTEKQIYSAVLLFNSYLPFRLSLLVKVSLEILAFSRLRSSINLPVIAIE